MAEVEVDEGGGSSDGGGGEDRGDRDRDVNGEERGWTVSGGGNKN
jgi:hypothetical protein